MFEFYRKKTISELLSYYEELLQPWDFRQRRRMELALKHGERVVYNLKPITKQPKPNAGEKQLQRVRRICLALPETTEKLSHGEPTFFVAKRVFAMCSNNHHNDGHIAVVVPAAIGIQTMLIEKAPEKFYRPPYVGGSGWIGIELGRVNDKELAFHLHEAWRLIAPEKFHALVENPNGKKSQT